MPPPEVQEMHTQAGKLRTFADHVEKLANPPHDYAAKMDWSGPLTDRVRGEIGGWKRRCGEVATKIREEADRLDKEADRLANSKKS